MLLQKLSQVRRISSLAPTVFIFLWTILYFISLSKYPGSWLVYSLFSAVFLVLILSAFYRPTTFSYPLLATFLWLGFWLKAAAHQVFFYPFGEPVGGFPYTPKAWDDVLVVSTVGCLGVLIARVIALAGARGTLQSSDDRAPDWFVGGSIVAWIALATLTAACVVANAVFGIQEAGLVPKIILPFHLNAAVSLLLVAGLPIFCFAITWYDMLSGRSFLFSTLLCLSIICVCSISIFSRGQFVFDLVAVIFALSANRTRIRMGLLRTSLVVATSLFLLIASVPLVNFARSVYYPHADLTDVASSNPRSDTVTNRPAYMPLTPPWGSAWIGPARPDPFTPVPAWLFVLERWVGLEGVMAVQSYEGRGQALFQREVTERPELGKSTLYQTISHSHYPGMDLTKYSFATLPGATAFFYMSDSLFYVLIGMVVLTLAMQWTELGVARLTGSPLVTAFWGVSMASVVSQFGLTPRGLLPYILSCVSAFLLLGGLRSRWFSSVIRRPKA